LNTSNSSKCNSVANAANHRGTLEFTDPPTESQAGENSHEVVPVSGSVERRKRERESDKDHAERVGGIVENWLGMYDALEKFWIKWTKS
jgi:hypothetical protein